MMLRQGMNSSRIHTVVVLVVEVLVLVVLVFVVEDEEAETTVPSGEQGKSRSAVDSILVQ